MAFDIRATVNTTADSNEAAHAIARRLREVLADHGFTGIVEIREIGTTEAFHRDVVVPKRPAPDA